AIRKLVTSLSRIGLNGINYHICINDNAIFRHVKNCRSSKNKQQYCEWLESINASADGERNSIEKSNEHHQFDLREPMNPVFTQRTHKRTRVSKSKPSRNEY